MVPTEFSPLCKNFGTPGTNKGQKWGQNLDAFKMDAETSSECSINHYVNIPYKI